MPFWYLTLSFKRLIFNTEYQFSLNQFKKLKHLIIRYLDLIFNGTKVVIYFHIQVHFMAY